MGLRRGKQEKREQSAQARHQATILFATKWTPAKTARKHGELKEGKRMGL
jgi:hypothetical protein